MRRKATALIAALLLTACDRTSPGERADPGGAPKCTPISQPTVAPVEGLIPPPEARIHRAKPSGQKLTHVRGYVDLEPIDIRKFYESLQREKGYEFFLLEDEVIEAEVFFSDGTWRNYVRALLVCPGRSELFIVLAPEDYSRDKKTPRANP